MKKRILTGDRPTGKLHLGHYIGSLRNRIRLQDEYECFFIIADLHTLTTRPERSSELKENIHQMVLDYLSVGIDPEKCTIYIQSQIPEVGELAVILSNFVSVPRLERMPTLKDVMRDSHISIPSYGLLGYPVLQSADILMPRAHLVPVGKDQSSHIEVTREIAREFNRLYGETLPVPEALIPDDLGTLPGTDGSGKMSKSAGNVINLSDSPEEVEKKVKGMYTDPTRLHASDPGHIEGNPVFVYLDAFATEADKAQIEKYKEAYTKGQVGDTEVKSYLTKVLNNFLDPIRQRRDKFEKEPELVEKILKEGTEKARIEAQATLKAVKSAMKMDYFEMGVTLSKPTEEDEKISIDEFLRTKLKVGTVLNAEVVENSDKLLKLEIDLGEEKPRQILAGIKEFYSPEDFIGNQVVVVSNLEPRVMRGLESQGMMLAADSTDGPIFLTVPKKVSAGTKIR